MTKGRLLASACALALLAAPAVAATTDSSGSMSPGPNDTMQHHHMTHAWHGSRQSDSSQNGTVEQLNEQSLAAARKGQSFEPGSGAGGSAGGGSGGESGNSGNKM